MAKTIDITSLKTIETPVSGGGCHTSHLVIGGGMSAVEAIERAAYHAEAALDVLFPMTMNASAEDDSLYPAIIPLAICKALIESVTEAIQKASLDAVVEADHG